MLEDTNFPVTRKKGFLPIFVETAYPGLSSAIIKTRNEAWHVCTFPGLLRACCCFHQRTQLPSLSTAPKCVSLSYTTL